MAIMPSIKINQEFYDRLKKLRYRLFLEHEVEFQIVKLLERILQKVDWEAFEREIEQNAIAKKKAMEEEKES